MRRGAEERRLACEKLLAHSRGKMAAVVAPQGRRAQPRVDPGQWAAQRRAKVQRAEQAREERRAKQESWALAAEAEASARAEAEARAMDQPHWGRARYRAADGRGGGSTNAPQVPALPLASEQRQDVHRDHTWQQQQQQRQQQ